MLTKLRRTTWQDWMTPLQVVVGLSLLAIAIAEVPGNEGAGRPGPHSTCSGCGPETR